MFFYLVVDSLEFPYKQAAVAQYQCYLHLSHRAAADAIHTVVLGDPESIGLAAQVICTVYGRMGHTALFWNGHGDSSIIRYSSDMNGRALSDWIYQLSTILLLVRQWEQKVFISDIEFYLSK